MALNQLQKMFVVFAVKVDGAWLGPETVQAVGDGELGIYNAYMFPTYRMKIDFSRPEEAQNELVSVTEG